MRERLLRPLRLSDGDTVGLIAPASPPPEPAAIDRSIEALKRLGFKPLPGKSVRRRNGYLAGNDTQRAADLHRFFEHEKVRAIFCLRGGYGTARFLGELDYALIRRNPKILLGYSDITSLHCALFSRTGLVSFHGPMLNSELSKRDLPEFTRDSFFRTLTQPEPPGSILQQHPGSTVRKIHGGIARGRLVGGNLSVLCTTIGTPWQPGFKGCILFLEDIGEAPYRIDRLLTHLLNAGLLQQVAGVAAGIFRDCIDTRAVAGGEYRQTVEEVLQERLRPLGVPVLSNLPFGHVPLNATLPIGPHACLDADRGDLIIEEAAVR